MKVYVDTQFCCHPAPMEGLTEYEVPFFDDKPEAIDIYRYVPMGASWVRKDGTVFHGEMIVPASDDDTDITATAYIAELETALAEIRAAGDPAELQDMQDALNVLGVTDDG